MFEYFFFSSDWSIVLLVSLSAFSGWKFDRAKILAGQIASKGYFAGEAAGMRLASHEGRVISFLTMTRV
jgi:hypothetical protein